MAGDIDGSDVGRAIGGRGPAAVVDGSDVGRAVDGIEVGPELGDELVVGGGPLCDKVGKRDGSSVGLSVTRSSMSCRLHGSKLSSDDRSENNDCMESSLPTSA